MNIPDWLTQEQEQDQVQAIKHVIKLLVIASIIMAVIFYAILALNGILAVEIIN